MQIVSLPYNKSAVIVELMSVYRTESQFSSLNSLYAEIMYRNWEYIYLNGKVG